MKKKDNMFNLLKTSIIVLVLYFAWSYIIGAIVNFIGLKENASLYVLFSSNFLLLFMIIGIYYNDLKEQFKDLKKNFRTKYIKGIKIFAIGLILYFIGNAVCYAISGVTQDNTDSMLLVFKQIPLLFLTSTLFYYPVVEELVFKKTFKDIINNKWLFVIITGLINATFQVALSSSSMIGYIYIIPTTILLSSLSLIYYETDNLLVPMSFRMIYNLIPNIAAIVTSAILITL